MAASIVTLIVDRMPTRFGDMADQVRRAALSCTSNIAEGAYRFQKSEKNGRHFFDSARGSASEVASQILQALRLFRERMSAEERALLDYARSLLFHSVCELEKLVDNPKLLLHPERMGVFHKGEIATLAHVLTEIDHGKNVYYALFTKFPEKKVVEQAKPVRYSCFECSRSFPRGRGRMLRIAIRGRFSVTPKAVPTFFCNECLREKGRPVENYEGVTQWKPWGRKEKNSRPTFPVDNDHMAHTSDATL